MNLLNMGLAMLNEKIKRLSVDNLVNKLQLVVLVFVCLWLFFCFYTFSLLSAELSHVSNSDDWDRKYQVLIVTIQLIALAFPAVTVVVM